MKEGGQSVTGCAATALAQVLYYHRWPQKAVAGPLPAYVNYMDKTTEDELPSVTFDWDNMLDVYDGSATQEQCMAVATLMRYCGQLNRMAYSPIESSARYPDLDMLAKCFGYSAEATFVFAQNYGIQSWYDLLYNELREGRPLLFSASSTGGGHAFVVDGYTVDGGELGEIEYENFNAASALVSIAGLSVHPGAAKGKMINALRLACEYNAMIPSDETPETTADRQGFYHLTSMAGFVESAIMQYIIRDHDRESFEKRKEFLRACVARLNASYGRQVATVKITDQYYNMKQQIDRHPHVVSLARQAMEACGVVPKEQPIRGGTDGAQLSIRGLPCPNLFAGGLNFHGPYEFVSIQTMLKARDVIVKLCELAAQ